MILLLLSLITNSFATTANFFEDVDNFKNKSLNIQSEQQKLNSSTDFLLSKKLFWTPKLNISLQESQTNINSITTSKSNNISANLNWNLFRGGSDWNKFQDAKAQKEAQELQLLNEGLRTEVSASDLIFKSLYLIEIVRIQKEFLKLKEESLKIVTDRYHQGKLPLQEVSKSEVDFIQQKSKLRSSQLDLLENKSQITSLFVDNIKTSEWPFDEKVTAKLPSNSKIPLVDQKYWLNKSLEESWKESKGLHWPTLDLDLQRIESPIKNRTEKEWVGLLTLTFPIWNQYETSANVSSAYANYITSLNDYKNTQQALSEKNTFLKDKIETARLNLSESKTNLEKSRKLYQDILNSFRLGRISTNDLFLEQNRLLDSENALALNQLTFHQSLIETCALAGINSKQCL
jgi:outer membrane protein TolC